MGFYVGPAPISIDEVYGIYYQYEPKTEDTAWLVGYDVYLCLARMQYSSGQYLIDMTYMPDARPRLFGLEIDISNNRSEICLHERPHGYTGKTIPLTLPVDRCPLCGAPSIVHPVVGCEWTV